LGSYLIWQATHETGDSSEWQVTPDGATSVVLSATVSSQRAHSGRYSLMLTSSDTTPIGAGFDFNSVEEAYFSGWFLLEPGYDAATPWSIISFASRGQDCTGPEETCAGVDVRLRSVPTGQVLLYLFNSEPDVLQPPLADPPTYVPMARWFHLEARYKRAIDHNGRFHFWMDGKPLFRFEGWRTAEFDNLLWYLANPPPSESGAAQVLYVDDVAISHIAVTPTGVLD
jgi:hypothetical protein